MFIYFSLKIKNKLIITKIWIASVRLFNCITFWLVSLLCSIRTKVFKIRSHLVRETKSSVFLPTFDCINDWSTNQENFGLYCTQGHMKSMQYRTLLTLLRPPNVKHVLEGYLLYRSWVFPVFSYIAMRKRSVSATAAFALRTVTGGAAFALGRTRAHWWDSRRPESWPCRR